MALGNATLVERLQQLSSSVISDVLDVSGYMDQSLSGTIRPLAPTMRLAERLAAIEEKIVAGLNAGAPREKVFAANPRFDHIRRLK